MKTNSTASLVFLNGKILSMDDVNDGRHQAVAVVGTKVLAVGSNIEIKKYITPETQVIDLKGSLLMPGFIESHAHFYSLGASLLQLDLVGTKSVAEISEMITQAAANVPEGQWIIGRGWDQNDWEDKSLPTVVQLDGATKHHPVYLKRVDGHAVWVNSYALNLAGIDSSTSSPPGGEILKNRHGKPTGVLVDNAIELVQKLLNTPSEKEKEKALLEAQCECFRKGITSFHDMGIGSDMLRTVERLYKEEKLKIRLYEMLSSEDKDFEVELKKGPRINLYDERLTIRGVKDFMDGALGSRGALLIEPYSDRNDTRGLQLSSDEDIKKVAELCRKYGFQLSVHAIGDLANRKVLDLYEKTIGRDEKGQFRWRIEHAQILDETDIGRFASLRVLPSMQPTHCTSDMPWAPKRLGEKRLSGGYVWRSLINSGIIIPGGSDAPVEDVNPLWGIYAAVTRQDQSGYPKGGWNSHERVSISEALKMFTVWGAWAAFEEHCKGRIRPGFLADFIVLDKDISTISPREILKTKVLMTVIGGEILYDGCK